MLWKGSGDWPPEPHRARSAQMPVPGSGRRGQVVASNTISVTGWRRGPSWDRIDPQRPLRRRFTLRPQVRRDYPLNLSISISGGKETYKDSPSNGERTGKSPAWESGGFAVRIVVCRSVLSGGPGPSPLEGGAGEGESPVVPGPCRTTRRCRRVGLFGNAAPIGR